MSLPPGLPLDKQIDHLRAIIERLRQQIEELKKPTPEETAAEKREREERHAERAQAELANARAEAIKQAKGAPARKGHAAKPPRPALLRMILRATR